MVFLIFWVMNSCMAFAASFFLRFTMICRAFKRTFTLARLGDRGQKAQDRVKLFQGLKAVSKVTY